LYDMMVDDKEDDGYRTKIILCLKIKDMQFPK
jgi:hypothetical protein